MVKVTSIDIKRGIKTICSFNPESYDKTFNELTKKGFEPIMGTFRHGVSPIGDSTFVISFIIPRGYEYNKENKIVKKEIEK